MSERLLENMGILGCQPKTSVHSEKQIQPSLQGQTPSNQNPTSQSGYANSLRNILLQEAMDSLLDKQAIEMVKIPSSLTVLESPLLSYEAKQHVVTNSRPQFPEQVS